MFANGNYRLVLHPGVDPLSLEALLLGGDPGFQLQLTRITTGVGSELWRVVGPEKVLGREYVLAVSVQLMGDGVRYDFDDNLERIQDAVKDYATVLGVDVFEPIRKGPRED